MKDFKEQEIGDDEIRILGKKPKFSSKTKKIIAIVLAIVLLVGIFLLLFLTKFGENDDLPVVDLPEDEYVISTEEITTDNSDNSGNSTVSMVDTVLVDTAGLSVSLRIFTPMNATMDLFVGEIDTNDNNILLAIQAAEIRADNDSILGDFVLNGDLLAEGKTRKGFCALIDGQAIIGVGEGDTYLDKAIESDGDYFRQYPLVSNGCQVSNKPQNITIRRALCVWKERVVVVQSLDTITLDAFSQSLVQLGVTNAINLMGGYKLTQGWVQISPKNRLRFYEKWREKKENRSFLVFRKEN